MKRIVSAAALTACSLLSTSALALGLGEINVRSQLSQRFSASIPLNTDSADQAANLRVSLAGVDEYAQAGIERDLVLSSLRFSIKADAQPRIEISSTAPINEPFLQVLVEVKGGGQRLVRQYTVLLDPPASAQTAGATAAKPAPAIAHPPASAPVPPPAPAVQAKPEAAPAVVPPSVPAAARPAVDDSFYQTADEAARSKPAANAEAVVAAAAADASEGALYGPVKSGETLWSIAVAMRPDSTVMVDQVLLALYKANPRAFESGLNSLLRGAMLRVPTLAEMTSVSPETAQAEIARLRGVRPRRSEPSSSRRPPRLEPAEILAPPPASMQSPEPPASTPAVAPAAPAEPAPDSVPPAPAAAADAAAAAPADAAPAADAALTDSDPAAGTEPAADAVAGSPEAPPAEAPPAADADVVETSAAPARSAEPIGVVEKLLLPMLFGLIAISGLLWLVGRIRRRRARVPQEPVANLPPPVRSAESAARRLASETARAPAAAAAAAAVPASVVMPEPEASSAPAGDSFAPVASSTPLVDLDGGDPLAEAEFNIAYGLHDEAIPLLRRAQAAEPQRTEIGVKLAKSLLAVGRREEFDATVAELQTRLPADELRELLLLAGASTAAAASPAVAAPESAATQAAVQAAEPAEPSDPMPSAEIAFEPQSATVAPAASTDAPLEFELESFDLPPVEPQTGFQKPLPAVAEPDDKGAMVEFDLSGFDLEPAAPADGAAPAAAVVSTEPMAAVEFDLGDFEPAALAVPSPAPPAAPTTLGDTDIQFDDFDFGVEPEESSAISGDEAGTKLDLARAYVEMGDNEMARGLLNEVVNQGNDAQRADARTLLDRLG